MTAPLTRRALLGATGALLVAFGIPVHAADPPKLPGSLKDAPRLASWIQIDPDGAVTVFTGKAELGQGIRTALIQVAAEQLDLAPGQITLVTADTARTPNEGFTAGSHSMQDSGAAIMNAAAEIRAILVAEAADRLGIPAASLVTAGGRVAAPDGRSLGYGELVSGLSPDRLAQPNAPLKDPASYTVIGKPFPRVDIPAKVSGGVAYVQDLSPARHAARPHCAAAPLWRHARRRWTRPRGGHARRGEDRARRQLSRRHRRRGEWQAITAMRALAAAAEWSGGRTMPDQASIFDTVRALPASDTVILDRQADTPAPARTVKARYRRPYGMHGSIGPSCAVAQLQDGVMTVWTHTQGVFFDRAALAELLGDAGGQGPLHPHRGRRLLRPQRRRRCRCRRRPLGPRRAGQPRARAMDAGAGKHLGAVHPRDGDRGGGFARRQRAKHRRLAVWRLEQHP